MYSGVKCTTRLSHRTLLHKPADQTHPKTRSGDHSRAADQAIFAAMHRLDVPSRQLHISLLSLTENSNSHANHAAQSIATFLDCQDEPPQLSNVHRETCCHLCQAASSWPGCSHVSQTTPNILERDQQGPQRPPTTHTGLHC